MDNLWGIDLGGTKIEGVVLRSNQDPSVLARQRIDTEADKGYEHVLKRIKLLIDQIAKEVGHLPDTIGIGTPGTLDPPTQTLKNSNSTNLNGKAFKTDLEKVLGFPIVMANDANCFALAEARMGVVPERCPQAKVVFGVIMGTGVGGGIVINGKVLAGAQGIGGEWGHSFLDDSGGQCYCGDIGCTETIISGPALEKYYYSLTKEKLSLRTITEKHIAGTDIMATKTIERLLQFFGRGMSNVINILDPDIVVLGGGVGNIDLLYTEGVNMVAKHVFNNKLGTLIAKPKLGDSAGVFGAAFLMS